MSWEIWESSNWGDKKLQKNAGFVNRDFADD